jgi:putative flippase GtrA
VINNVVLIGGDRLGVAYPVLVVLTWAIGGSVAYYLHVHLTFRTTANWTGFVRFMAGVAVGIPLAIAVLLVLVSWARLPMWIAAPTATLLMLLYNYINARVAILWRKSRSENRSPKHDGRAR